MTPIDTLLYHNHATLPSDTDPVSGAKAVETGSAARNTVAAAQVQRTNSNQNFTARLQIRLAGPGGPGIWYDLKQFTQAKNGEVFTFNLTLSAQYRFTLISAQEGNPLADSDDGIRVMLST